MCNVPVGSYYFSKYKTGLQKLIAPKILTEIANLIPAVGLHYHSKANNRFKPNVGFQIPNCCYRVLITFSENALFC